MNLCRSCQEDFASVRLFDAHRVGAHDYVFDADHLDGRRCLDVDEMLSRGWALDARGRWHDPARAADVQLRLAA